MAQTLTLDTVKDFYQVISKTPLFITSLKYREKLFLHKYCCDALKIITDYIQVLIDMNPEYEYPEDYLPGRKFEWWAEHYNSGQYYKVKGVSDNVFESIKKSKKFKMAFEAGNKRNDSTDNNINDPENATPSDGLIRKQRNESTLKRTFAFCVCLHYKSGHLFKIGNVNYPKMTNQAMEEYITKKFIEPYKEKNPNRHYPSAQNTRKLLMGGAKWGLNKDLKFEDDKKIFTYNREGKEWNFDDVAYNDLMTKFDADWNKALVMVDDLKELKKD